MWILYGFLSALTAALMTVVAKIGLKNIDPTFATGIRSFIMFLFMLLVVAFSGKLKGFLTLDQKAFWIIVSSAIFGALSWFFYFLALRGGPTSKVAALDRSSLILVILFSVLFLSEKMSLKLGLGTLLASIGILLITLA